MLGICPEGGERLVNPNSKVDLQVQPNPGYSVINVEVNLIEKGRTELKISDVNGKIQKAILDEIIDETGLRTFNINVDDLFTVVYILTFKSPTVTISGKLEIVK